MRRVLTILSLFAVCFCLSCFVGVSEVGAFSGETFFTNDVKVKYGGAAMAVTPTPYPSGVVQKVIDGTDEYGDSRATFSGSTALSQWKLESVIDAAVMLKNGDGIVYRGDPTSPFGKILVLNRTRDGTWRSGDPDTEHESGPDFLLAGVGGSRPDISGNGGPGILSSA